MVRKSDVCLTIEERMAYIEQRSIDRFDEIATQLAEIKQGIPNAEQMLVLQQMHHLASGGKILVGLILAMGTLGAGVVWFVDHFRK